MTALSPSPQPSLRAWVGFLLGCACFGYAFMQRVAPSVMTDELMRAFDVGAGVLGTLSAFYFYAYATMQMPIGVLMDRFGPRRLLSGAMALTLIGCLAFAYAEDLVLASIGRLLIGAAVAFGYVGSMTIAATWFPAARFTLLVGILQSVGMAGAITGQAPLSFLVSATGWQETILILGIIGAVLAVLIFFVVEEIPKSSIKTDGLSEDRADFREVLTNPQSWLCLIIGFTLTAPMLAFAGLWAVPWLTSVYGFDRTDGAATASLIFFAWALVGPFLGIATEKLGRRKPLIFGGLTCSAIGLAVLFFIPDLPSWSLAPLFMLVGAGGCTMILTFTLVREVNRPANSGAALGFVNMGVVASGALFQTLIGVMLDRSWDGALENGVRIYAASAYTEAFSIFVIASTVGILATCFMRETYGKQFSA